MQATPPKRPDWLTTANAMSVSRVPLAIAFLLVDNRSARVAILAVAALTDFLDGWLARHHAQSSRAGQLIDPAADKIFLVSALISLAVHGAVSTAGLFVLLARDFATVAGFIVVTLRRMKIKLQSRYPGKVVTVLQLATVLVLTAAPRLSEAAVWAVGTATAWAILDYISFAVASLRARSTPR